MSFTKDLREGEYYESFILWFLKRYYLPWLEKNKERMGVDLIDSVSGLTVEVKYDKLSSTTWNIYLEYECNKLPSWIMKYNNLSLFVVWNSNWFALVEWEVLLDIVTNQKDKFRQVNGWDWWRSKWLLIPIEYFKSLGRSFNIKY
jgi:hypothetical protein